MADNRLPSAAEVLVRIVGSKLSGCLNGQPSREVARQRIMRGGLVGDEIEVLASAGELRDDLGRVPLQADRQGPALGGGCADTRERVVERDRKSTRLNSSHMSISYAVFCLK